MFLLISVEAVVKAFLLNVRFANTVLFAVLFLQLLVIGETMTAVNICRLWITLLFLQGKYFVENQTQAAIFLC